MPKPIFVSEFFRILRFKKFYLKVWQFYVLSKIFEKVQLQNAKNIQVNYLVFLKGHFSISDALKRKILSHAKCPKCGVENAVLENSSKFLEKLFFFYWNKKQKFGIYGLENVFIFFEEMFFKIAINSKN